MITVSKPVTKIEKDVYISHYDAVLIFKIKQSLGIVEAIRVTRWLTDSGLAEAKNFVDSLTI